MKVTLAPDRIFLANFSNQSQAIYHDGRSLRDANQVVELRKQLKTLRRDPVIGPFLRIRPFRRISVITTTCTIVSDANRDESVSVGHAYYSRSEVDAGIPFNAPKAWRMALGRALADWPSADQTIFLVAFNDFLKKRHIQMLTKARAGHLTAF